MKKAELRKALSREKSASDWAFRQIDKWEKDARDKQGTLEMLLDALKQAEGELRQEKSANAWREEVMRLLGVMEISFSKELIQEEYLRLEGRMGRLLDIRPIGNERMTLNVRGQPIASWVDGKFERWLVQS